MNISRQLSSAVVLVLGCLATFSVQASFGTDLLSIKLLNAQVGWAANSSDLYWTVDAGATWQKRTPRAGTAEDIEDVFFLNVSTGWALLAHTDDRDEVHFDLASTNDSGQTWRIYSVVIPTDAVSEFSGHGSLYFVDRQHGWLNFGVVSGSSFRPGQLLATFDGGASWTYPQGQPGIFGSLCFFDDTNGMVVGGPEDTEIYVTHDASRTWHELWLDGTGALPASVATYGTPTCDGLKGLVPVTYSGPRGVDSAFVLFDSNDAGYTFRPARVLKDVGKTSPGQRIVTALAGSSLILLDAPTKSAIRARSIDTAGHEVTEISETSRATVGITGATFADALRGWAKTSAELLSTTDGGATWHNITPTGIPRFISAGGPVAEPSQLTERDLLPQSATAQSTQIPKNTRMGFDISLAPDDDTVMKAWWESSPYYVIGIYPKGAVNRKVNDALNVNLTPDWVTNVVGQGWGVLSLWLGLQAPCVDPQKHIVFTSFSTNAATAYKQGVSEAKLAKQKVQNLSSLLAPVIYFDMEPYSPTTANKCSAAVQAFLKGWVTQMHAKPAFNAGVYGKPKAAGTDFAKALPDDIWMNATTDPTVPPNVSIWKLKSQGVTLCDPFIIKNCTPTPALWTNHQRIHQYFIDKEESYGINQPPLSIDGDVVDADVAASSRGAKPYKFHYDPIMVQGLGAVYTSAFGLNNLGDIVGVFGTLNGQTHGFLYNGKSKGYSLLDCGKSTQPLRINDSGQVVGEYSTTSGGVAFFLYSNGKCTTISAPTGQKEMTGINAIGLVVGWYRDSKNNTVDFLDNTNISLTSTIPLPVQPAGNIDGNAYIPGFTSTGAVVVYNPVSKLSIPTPLKQTESLLGLNNSLLLGQGSVLYDVSAKMQVTVQGPLGAQIVSVTDVNDLSESVGTYFDSAFKSHSFFAKPQ